MRIRVNPQQFGPSGARGDTSAKIQYLSPAGANGFYQYDGSSEAPQFNPWYAGTDNSNHQNALRVALVPGESVQVYGIPAGGISSYSEDDGATWLNINEPAPGQEYTISGYVNYTNTTSSTVYFRFSRGTASDGNGGASFTKIAMVETKLPVGA